MKPLFFTPSARNDLRDARRWYEAQRLGLGAAFDLAIEATLTRIQRMPAAHAMVGPHSLPAMRCAVVRRFPYEIYYQDEEARVVILLVFHTAQNPARAVARLRHH